MNLVLKPFEDKDANLIRPWFDDPETKKRLGDRSWVDNIIRAKNEPVGTEFRGIKKLASFPFIAYDKGQPVGYIDGGIGDRYVKYNRTPDGKELLSGSEEIKSSALAFVVKPGLRGKGYASEMIKQLIAREELKEVGIFMAGVEPDNIGSQKALINAGFTSDYKPDFENMYYFLLRK